MSYYNVKPLDTYINNTLKGRSVLDLKRRIDEGYHSQGQKLGLLSFIREGVQSGLYMMSTDLDHLRPVCQWAKISSELDNVEQITALVDQLGWLIASRLYNALGYDDSSKGFNCIKGLRDASARDIRVNAA